MVRVVEIAKDPLDPPNYRFHKVPNGFGDAPVPILHSPPRKVTVQDMQDWKIPPCISNWKNARGLTIPLDKRLAADGRGLQQTEVNDNLYTGSIPYNFRYLHDDDIFATTFLSFNFNFSNSVFLLDFRPAFYF